MHWWKKRRLIDREIQRLKNTSVGANKEIQHFLEESGSSILENGGNSGRTDLPDRSWDMQHGSD